MASGAFRPYTAQDVIGALSDSIGALSGASSTSVGTGYFVEADETVGVTDSASVTTQVNAAWNQGQWGQFTWS